jgi:hypothetical protein
LTVMPGSVNISSIGYGKYGLAVINNLSILLTRHIHRCKYKHHCDYTHTFKLKLPTPKVKIKNMEVAFWSFFSLVSVKPSSFKYKIWQYDHVSLNNIRWIL